MAYPTTLPASVNISRNGGGRVLVGPDGARWYFTVPIGSPTLVSAYYSEDQGENWSLHSQSTQSDATGSVIRALAHPTDSNKVSILRLTTSGVVVQDFDMDTRTWGILYGGAIGSSVGDRTDVVQFSVSRSAVGDIVSLISTATAFIWVRIEPGSAWETIGNVLEASGDYYATKDWLTSVENNCSVICTADGWVIAAGALVESAAPRYSQAYQLVLGPDNAVDSHAMFYEADGDLRYDNEGALAAIGTEVFLICATYSASTGAYRTKLAHFTQDAAFGGWTWTGPESYYADGSFWAAGSNLYLFDWDNDTWDNHYWRWTYRSGTLTLIDENLDTDDWLEGVLDSYDSEPEAIFLLSATKAYTAIGTDYWEWDIPALPSGGGRWYAY